MKPTIGRIVLFMLRGTDADAINKRRTDFAENHKTDWPAGAQAHAGNQVKEGELYPMVITKIWFEVYVNGQVMLDGTDLFWATGVSQTPENTAQRPGEWAWPPRV